MMIFFACVLLLIMFFPRASCASGLPSLKVLSTPTCSVCAQMYRILDELDAGYGDKVKTERINLLENRETAAEFKVRFVPHLLFCDGDGKIVKEQVGYASLDKVLTIFKDAGINLE